MMFSWVFYGVFLFLLGVCHFVWEFFGGVVSFLFCFKQFEMSLKQEISKGNFILNYIFLFEILNIFMSYLLCLLKQIYKLQ